MHPNDPSLRSFVEVAADSDFPIQNLLYGVISTQDDRRLRVAVAIGDHVLDLGMMEDAGLLPRVSAKPVFRTGSINALMANGAYGIGTVRRKISELLRHDSPTLRDNEALAKRALIPMKNVKPHRPVDVPGYTDFYSSREHATNVGTMFRGKDNALQENWLHIPIGYNGRASTVVVSGTPVIRPQGQLAKAAGERHADLRAQQASRYRIGNGCHRGPCHGNGPHHGCGRGAIFDLRLRAVQRLERARHSAEGICAARPVPGQGLRLDARCLDRDERGVGAFRGAWPETGSGAPALSASRQAAQLQHPPRSGIETGQCNAGTIISVSNFKYMYWSSAQQLAHHSSSGCSMSVGDLIGSGTISGPDKGSYGSMLELSWGGKEPIELVEGGTRTFLEDGDTVTLRGYAQGDGYRIGFGEASGQILPAKLK